MFAPEGYNSFLRLRLVIRTEILRQYLSQPKEPSEGDAKNSYSGHVMESAASLVAHLAVNQRDMPVQLFTGEREPFMKLSSLLTIPPVALSLKQGPEVDGSRHFVSYIDMFKSGELSKAINEGRFEQPRVSVDGQSRNSAVNHATGCIDTSLAHASSEIDQIEAKLVRAKRDCAAAAASMLGVYLNTEYFLTKRQNQSGARPIRDPYKQLKIFDGYPVFLREGDFTNVLESLGINPAKYSKEQPGKLEPHELILMEYEAEPSTKDEIKERLFPEMSAREFGHHWWFAARTNPDIKNPGRKS